MSFIHKILFIFSYPSKISSDLHLTHVYVPAPLGAVLDHSPHLISSIIQSFCHRDPIDMKVGLFMKIFTLIIIVHINDNKYLD